MSIVICGDCHASIDTDEDVGTWLDDETIMLCKNCGEEIEAVIKTIDDMDYVKETCKPGKGTECCAYFVMGGEGAGCAKGTELAYTIELRLAEGAFTAQGDNCPGWDQAHDAK